MAWKALITMGFLSNGTPTTPMEIVMRSTFLLSHHQMPKGCCQFYILGYHKLCKLHSCPWNPSSCGSITEEHYLHVFLHHFQRRRKSKWTTMEIGKGWGKLIWTFSLNSRWFWSLICDILFTCGYNNNLTKTHIYYIFRFP